MRAKVAVVRTSPATVLRDIGRAMELAGSGTAIPRGPDVALKINLSWHFFVPACSTTPWQLDGVIRQLLREGHPRERLFACQNRTVVVDARFGEREHHHLAVVQVHGLRNVHLYEPEVEWVSIHDAVGSMVQKFRVLHRVYPHGFHIPKILIGSSIVHLPTVKTHVFTGTTGAMKNAFGGLLNEHRHWAHPVIHETLVDLLWIQQHIHAGWFAVMDGTWAGDGPGPRCLNPRVGNVLLASSDLVAIDAVAARLMGFDPLADLRYIRLAHDDGLGCGDPREIEIVGDLEAARENWRFQGPFRHMSFAARMQHAIYWGRLRRPIEWTLRSACAPWSYVASVVYHDLMWYPTHLGRIRAAMNCPWGWLWSVWPRVMLPADDLHTPGWPDLVPVPPRVRGPVSAFAWALRMLGHTIVQSSRLDRPPVRRAHH